MKKTEQSGLKIMLRLLGLVKQLTFLMIFAIILGTLGHLCGIFVAVIGAEGIALVAQSVINPMLAKTIGNIMGLIIAVALLKGLFHYGEQYCNHYIAFKILAILRQRVFEKLCQLCPAKFERKDKSLQIAIIANDLEELEKLFAHTISQVAIAALVSIIMSIFISMQYRIAGILAAIAYVTIGGMIPASNELNSEEAAINYRAGFGRMNGFIFGILYGMDDIIQFLAGEKTLKKLNRKSDRLAQDKSELVVYEKKQKLLTNIAIEAFSLIILGVMFFAYNDGKVNFEQVMLASVAMMTSFGPVVALASITKNFNQAVESGKRILELLEEEPEVDEVFDGVSLEMATNAKGNIVTVNNVSFSYDGVAAVKEKSLTIPKGKILGIHGPSGVGKSSFLRLLMRFWNVDAGQIHYYDNEDGPVTVDYINSASLRDNISFVDKQTWVFHGTLADNIAIGKLDATRDEIIAAAKKASIHDFIAKLSQGYDTVVGENGFTLTEGEKQRIALARAFLHDGKLMLMDEPTSNLDALNEGIILKSIKEGAVDKTVVIVSHRKSTIGVADSVIEF
ncbi:MAG: ABC transporter ATP-binding protein/permease [Pseudobutyrivibrio sp.]|nr:ABC transporter ATP-binding protein/permease [Pseudobutyrivibrio sp.]